MHASPDQDFTAALAGALDWWREAGVDCGYDDAPKNWIAPVAEIAPPIEVGSVTAPAPPPAPKLGGERSSWPIELEQFAPWWLAEPALGPVEGRIPPRGAINASVMVLVEHPEACDTERLLSGPEGRLLDAMLTAMQIAPDQAYVASVLPRYTPMADWGTLADEGVAEITAHLVALAAPRRLIAFGSNILPLLGHDPANNPRLSSTFNHEGLTIPLLPALSLSALLTTPRRKAGLWRDWLEWTGPTTGNAG